jgi:transposase
MPSTPLSELIPVLQVAIGPVILISGVGLLLLSLTNRYARTIDRSRQLVRELRELVGANRQRLEGQIDILYLRARLIRRSILQAAVSVLLAAVLIMVLFVSVLLKMEAGLLICLLFIGCMAALIASLAAFIRDMNLSLGALKLELAHRKTEH